MDSNSVYPNNKTCTLPTDFGKLSDSAIYQATRASRASGGFGRLAPRAPRRLGQPWPVQRRAATPKKRLLLLGERLVLTSVAARGTGAAFARVAASDLRTEAAAGLSLR